MYKFRNYFFISLLSFLLIATLIGCSEEGDDDDDDVSQVSKAAYIVNGTAETLSVFDIENSKMQNDVLTVGKWPADIKIHGDNAYVTSTGDNVVHVIDLESLTEIGIIDIGAGAGPEKVDFVGDNKAYVSCLNINSVKVVDLAARQVTKTIEVGLGPWGVAAVGQKVYVCNPAYDFASQGYGQGTVSVIDSSTDEVVKTIDVETNPTEIAVSGNKVIVQCTGNYVDITGKLCIIDTSSDEVTQTIDLGTTPSGIAASPNGKVYVTDFMGLIPVDIGSGVAGIPLADFAGGAGLAFDSDGNGYITVPDWNGTGGDKLLVMDAAESLVNTYTPGGGASIIAIRD